MSDLLTEITALRRPKSLVRAAHYAKAGYRRDTHLPRLLETVTLPSGTAALRQLSEIESSANQRRKAADASYSTVRHIEVLAALLAEAEQLRDALAFPQRATPATAFETARAVNANAAPSPRKAAKVTQMRLA